MVYQNVLIFASFILIYSLIARRIEKTVVIIALAFSCFTAAQIAGGSGFIACFTGGLLYSVINRKYKHELLEASEGAGDTLSMLTWFIFGSVVIAKNIQFFSWEVIIYALLSLTLIRMIPVLLSLINTGIPWKEKIFISPYTVNTHRANILVKTGKAHISDLIYDLKEQGLL
jgi:NhaP-type Na+/H+ or K+/H+ antiporter